MCENDTIHLSIFNRFIVREFDFDAKTVQKERDEKGKLELQLKKQFVSCNATLDACVCA